MAMIIIQNQFVAILLTTLKIQAQPVEEDILTFQRKISISGEDAPCTTKILNLSGTKNIITLSKK